ncbi:MAG: molybdopterin-synthase adenylyltransferase MoeB [Phycisphaeraceae bacterium]
MTQIDTATGGTGAATSAVELSKEEIKRYSRHLILPEVTLAGQKKLKAASVLLIGAGGLGAPVSMYLAAAGVGRLGIVDFDTVDHSNLQRQVLFATADVGRPKLEAAKDRLSGINPHVTIDTYDTRLRADNAMQILGDYDIVIDGTDNFPTRYCVNDACVMLRKPNVYGSIYRFEGQATVFDPRPNAAGNAPGPCYRCLYPDPPPPGMVPSCAEGGVLGVLPGVIGAIQATEAVKMILGQGETLVGRLLRFNALAMSFKQFKLRRDPDCPVCGDHPTIKELIDYEQFCGIRGEESDTIIRDGQAVPAITVQQLKAKLDGGDAIELIDVREPQEYQICHIPQAKLIPLGTIAASLPQFDSTKQYVVHCKLGGRSAQAVELMRQAGLNATNVSGGIHAWATQIDPTMPTY